ncbi:MAG: isopentenyl-diphosphate Delta-isomerase [Candidatus Pacebacteria bacterium]|nr:isopentenyl-diphosphate Delta-isomerase [Candidatus Paceibacterota bacterium]
MGKHIILVNEKDEQVGEEEKLKAHLEGKLHRCLSIFIFNSKGEMLLQRRAKEKYHSGGLWTNACCGHQDPGEENESAAHRCLNLEMGFDCPLKEIFTFTYRAELDHGITENEFDHVFMGMYDGKISPNPEEAEDFRWMSRKALREDVKKNPEKYTYWFKICFERAITFLKKN